jgi:hypothetical protein
VEPIYTITALEPDERTADELRKIAEATEAESLGLMDDRTIKLCFPSRLRPEVTGEIEYGLSDVFGDDWELRYRIDPASIGTAM